MKGAGEGLRCGDGVKGLFGLGKNGVWSALIIGKGGRAEWDLRGGEEVEGPGLFQH